MDIKQMAVTSGRWWIRPLFFFVGGGVDFYSRFQILLSILHAKKMSPKKNDFDLLFSLTY